MTDQNRGTGVVAIILGALVFLSGLALALGGAKLAMLGGSLYYLLGGILLLIAGVMTVRGKALGGHLFGAFLAITILWSLIEVGFASWPLTARLLAPAALGLLFFIPAARRVLCKGALSSGLTGLFGVVLIVGAFAFRPTMEIAAPDGELTLASAPAMAAGDNWSSWGGTIGGSRFSTLAQITPANVAKLEKAWTFRTGIPSDPATGYLSATPITAEGRMYLCAQDNSVTALDPETGKQIWKFDPKINPEGASAVRTCRGVTYALVDGAKECASRILTATFDGRLIALDPATGKLCAGFGNNGTVNLYEGMGVIQPGFYYSSAPPTVANGKIVLGGWVADNISTDEPSGVIRAFDLATGKLAWAWDAGNPANSQGPAEGQHYTRHTPNAWAPMSADENLGLVYVATGNPTPDYYGGNRPEESRKYGSSVVALDLANGQVRWHFQTAHQDLWDYDIPAQPSLFDFKAGKEAAPAIAIPTKRGEIFVLDRRTGAPLIPVEERPVPQRGAVEKVSATQPFSKVHTMSGRNLVESDMWGLTPFDQLWCRVRFKELRYDGYATPPGQDESLIYPSIGGGMNFGGVAIDPMRRLMVANALHYGTIVEMVPREETDRLLKEAAAKGTHSVTEFDVPQPQLGTPWGARVSPFASPLGVPCNAPPFGRIAGIDLDTGKVRWERPFGTARDAGPFGLEMGLPLAMGAPNFGGSLTTASGLTFIGAAREKAFRAFDTASGKELWHTRLPASAQTVPMTFTGPRDGCQYIVVTSGGHNMLQSPLSDTVVAFRLPGCASKQKG
ncbi:MAG: membrane-bound PQQ-dependent dehydrogenase, glucose/quinate/shikimate family [Caenibius sp.]